MRSILYYQGFPYIFEIIYFKIISCHHNNPYTDDFGIEKTGKLVVRKYFSSTFCQDIKAYVKGGDIFVTSKRVCHKQYRDFQLLPGPIYC